MRIIELKMLPVLFLAGVVVICGYIAAVSMKSHDASRGYENGVYRGVFLDKGEMEVNIEFSLIDNKVEDIKFRYLKHGGIDYLGGDADRTVFIRGQFRELISHLIGRDVRKSVNDLYLPGKIITRELDGITGATIRSGKVISAIRDALNRGAYARF